MKPNKPRTVAEFLQIFKDSGHRGGTTTAKRMTKAERIARARAGGLTAAKNRRSKARRAAQQKAGK
jgi:hypothetical protein